MIKFSLRCCREEKDLLCWIMRQNQKELAEKIRKETKCCKFQLEKVCEDEKIVQGTFKTDNRKQGTFSFCKSIVPALVVTVE